MPFVKKGFAFSWQTAAAILINVSMEKKMNQKATQYLIQVCPRHGLEYRPKSANTSKSLAG